MGSHNSLILYFTFLTGVVLFSIGLSGYLNDCDKDIDRICKNYYLPKAIATNYYVDSANSGCDVCNGYYDNSECPCYKSYVNFNYTIKDNVQEYCNVLVQEFNKNGISSDNALNVIKQKYKFTHEYEIYVNKNTFECTLSSPSKYVVTHITLLIGGCILMATSILFCAAFCLLTSLADVFQ